MIVSITGGTGFIGRRLVQRHLAAGDEVRVLTRRPSAPASCRRFEGDLATGRIPAAFVAGADLLYHCAGEIRSEEKMYALHVEGTRALASMAAGTIGRWVHLSSVGVYGPRRRGDIGEAEIPAPVGVYEETKYRSEEIVLEASRNGAMQVAVLRPSIIFGEDMPNQSLRQWIGVIDRGAFFFIGPRGAVANYVHVDNVVHALQLCAKHPSAAGEIFNLSDQRTVEEFVGTIAAALNRPPPRLRLPESPLRMLAAVAGLVPSFPLTSSRIDALTTRARYPSGKIAATLGYRPVVSVEEGLRSLVESWRAEHKSTRA